MHNSKPLPITCTDAILESISDGVFTIDQSWRITSFNRAAEEITGISREKAMGCPCSEVFRSSMCETSCALSETLKSGRPIINRAGYIINAAGKRVPITVSTAVLKDECGEVIGGAETFRDMSEVEALRSELKEHYSIGSFVSRSSSMAALIDLAKAVAGSPSSALLEGETGTGKEVLARAIHLMSDRAAEPFIAINCGALPDSLLESELFGYKKGAFTGADKDKPGRFALAGRGTIFLDEIGEISAALQVRLLRVLQERSYEPLGATASEKLGARIIAATHRNLSQMVEEGTFRADLFYRINVVALKIPPLRRRKEDIPLLAEHFIDKLNRLQKRHVPGISPESYSPLMEHDWPGNVRELENLIERAFILCGNNQIEPLHLPDELTLSKAADSIKDCETIDSYRNNSERSLIRRVLKEEEYSIQAAAKRLNIHKTTLYRKIKRLNLSQFIESERKS